CDPTAPRTHNLSVFCLPVCGFAHLVPPGHPLPWHLTVSQATESPVHRHNSTIVSPPVWPQRQAFPVQSPPHFFLGRQNSPHASVSHLHSSSPHSPESSPPALSKPEDADPPAFVRSRSLPDILS